MALRNNRVIRYIIEAVNRTKSGTDAAAKDLEQAAKKAGSATGWLKGEIQKLAASPKLLAVTMMVTVAAIKTWSNLLRGLTSETKKAQEAQKQWRADQNVRNINALAEGYKKLKDSVATATASLMAHIKAQRIIDKSGLEERLMQSHAREQMMLRNTAEDDTVARDKIKVEEEAHRAWLENQHEKDSILRREAEHAAKMAANAQLQEGIAKRQEMIDTKKLELINKIGEAQFRATELAFSDQLKGAWAGVMSLGDFEKMAAAREKNMNDAKAEAKGYEDMINQLVLQQNKLAADRDTHRNERIMLDAEAVEIQSANRVAAMQADLDGMRHADRLKKIAEQEAREVQALEAARKAAGGDRLKQADADVERARKSLETFRKMAGDGSEAGRTAAGLAAEAGERLEAALEKQKQIVAEIDQQLGAGLDGRLSKEKTMRLQMAKEDELSAARIAEGKAQDRLSAAQAAAREAWMQYRDPERFRAAKEEREAEAAARREFAREERHLRGMTDWRTRQDLSDRWEAVRNVVIADEEERAARRNLEKIEQNTGKIADEIRGLLTFGG